MQWNKFKGIYENKIKNNEEWKQKQAADRLKPKEDLDDETL